jgi:hypothetical protein
MAHDGSAPAEAGDVAATFTVGQTVGQPRRTAADISDPAHAPDATLLRIPEQKFCPDTEGVNASMNVTDT